MVFGAAEQDNRIEILFRCLFDDDVVNVGLNHRIHSQKRRRHLHSHGPADQTIFSDGCVFDTDGAVKELVRRLER